ncbi:MAG TPA: threonine/serine dehydratase [Pseudonocardiaceae bacterium]
MLVTLDDVRAAADRIRGRVLRTPLLSTVDCPLWIKPESLQPTGAFKLRGATNAVLRLDGAARGVVTHSSGNHAQALAYAARAAGLPVTVVMPDDAVPAKIEATRFLGATVQLVPPVERASAAEDLARRLGLTMVPPYDHPHVIAGQGTVGLEIADDAPDVDLVLVPVGGGGLAAGVAVAIKALCPRAAVIGVEPELAADAAESLRRGTRTAWDPARTAQTSADGVRHAVLGELTWAHLSRRLDAIVTVTEEEIAAAVRFLAARYRVVAEPSGALSTAAYLWHADQLPAGRTVAVLSGGNAAPAPSAAP